MTSRRLRIGILAAGWWPERGGVESLTRDLAREFLRAGHEVRALVLDGSGRGEEGSSEASRVEGVELTRIAWTYIRARSLESLIRSPELEARVVSWCAANELDLLHIHHLAGWGLGVPPRLSELGLPLLWTLHDYWSVCPRGQLWPRAGDSCREVDAERCTPCVAATWPELACDEAPAEVTRDAIITRRLAAARAACAACDLVFVPSEAARATLLRAGLAEERIEVRENGLASASRVSIADPTDELRVGYLGAVQPSKGVLEIAELLADLGAPFTFEVHGMLAAYHGDSTHIRALESLAEKNERLHLHGPYERSRLAEILSNLHLVVVPSRWEEVYGLTAREARAAGLPVFASDTGGLADEAFELLPPGDPNAWRRALERFAADPAWRADLARQPFAPRRIEVLASEHLNDYETLLGARSSEIPPS